MSLPTRHGGPVRFQDRWASALPHTEPHGQALRATQAAWLFRIHSLPDAKRFPETAAAFAEIEARHLAVIRHVYGQRPFRALFPVWNDRGAAAAGFPVAESWTIPGGEWLDAARVVEVSAPVWADDARWPPVIHAVAEDVIDSGG